MMHKIKVILLINILCLVSRGSAECVTDEEIAEHIVLANSYVDDWRAASRDMKYAIGLCGTDSNRLCQILRNLAETNTNTRHVGTAMRLLTRHGIPAQLPYLYSVVTNKIRGAEAVKAILRIEGVTTNSILAVSNCLAQTRINVHDRYVLFCNFADCVYRLPSEDPHRIFGLDYVRWLAPRENSFCLVVDEELIKHNPSYRMSRRRLSTLRSVLALGMNDFQLTYVTNAINELVAYPEADLPE